MVILGIETSCDETAAAIVKNGSTILSDVKATSLDVHIKYGGIVPDKAAREQLQAILPITQEAVATLPGGLKAIDAIAVTYGPGLIGSLLIGVETAKTLALSLNKPIIPVNHLVGHIYANWLTKNTNSQTYTFPTTPPAFPALILIVSGGHSEFVLMKNHGNYQLLGSTRDDAAGECFDKCGRLLGLPYPFGIYVSQLAAQWKEGNSFTPKFPRPMIYQHNFEMSFSGLKTAVLNYMKTNKSLATTDNKMALLKTAVAHEVEEAITDVLVKKFLLAAKANSVQSLVLCGGVAANLNLREKLAKALKNSPSSVPLVIPDTKLCTDNAVAIAAAAYFNYHPTPWQEVTADPGIRFDANN